MTNPDGRWESPAKWRNTQAVVALPYDTPTPGYGKFLLFFDKFKGILIKENLGSNRR